MATTRTLTAATAGATTVDLSLLGIHGRVDVQAVPGLTTAEITISTTDDTGEAADAVTSADLRWDPRGALVARVQGQGVGDGTTTIVSRSGRTITMQRAGTVYGSVTGMVIDGDLTIVGGRVGGRGATLVQGPAPVVVTARVPEDSSVIGRTQSADLTTTGRLTAVAATTQSGDVSVGTVSTVSARTMSGDIRASWLGAGADLQTMSGDIRALAANPGAVTAGSMSGDVTVTASPDAPAGGPDVRATSTTGQVSIRR
ncbi:DUF4097 family beta strand repeat-containing protein [Kitasatospora sp. MY 5-36]|uniref:DUF4097 family beta strand repeat-containing protein n=1 Tax=Kitasatospora sp. MY 5-36 TaxID=1678027 RepID=UPI000670B68C|nr:DUF4097 family beta strand repeat-containing protein [Kitasatospora sp. MY 5-36]